MEAKDYLLWALAFGATGSVILMYRLMTIHTDVISTLLWAVIFGPIVLGFMLLLAALLRRLSGSSKQA